MLKRLEVYADAGLFGFLCSTIAFLVLSMGPGRLMLQLLGGRLGGMISMIGPAVLIGTALAVWAAWVLHHRTTHEPMTREESVRMSWFALGAVALSAGAVTAWTAFGGTTIAVGILATVLLLALAVWLVADGVVDIFRAREHITIDIVRVLTLGLLGAALIASLISPAAPGTDADISPYLVIGSAYMTVVAVLMYGYDAFRSWRSRTHVTGAPLSPGV